jgi:hypothetical protein
VPVYDFRKKQFASKFRTGGIVTTSENLTGGEKHEWNVGDIDHGMVLIQSRRNPNMKFRVSLGLIKSVIK